MQPATLNLYKQFRARAPFMLAGNNAALALSAAKTLGEFRRLEDEGLVRLRAVEEQESYLDAFGKPDAYTNAQGHEVSEEKALEELIETLERDGVWTVLTEYKACECKCCDHERWEYADSVGMCTGYSDPTSPFENCYVIDMMQAAIDAVGEREA